MLKWKYNWSQTITFAYMIIIMTGCMSTFETDQRAYFVVLGYLILVLPCLLLRGRLQIVSYPIIISLLLFLIWVYGIALGYIRGNNPSMIIRNFAGMSLYILVFLLLNSQVSNLQFLRLLRAISYYALFATIFTYSALTFFKLDFITKIPVINAYVGGGGIGGFVQYFCRELIHISFAYNFYKILNFQKVFSSALKPIFYVLLSVIALVFMNDSGGDALALGVIAVIIVLMQANRIRPQTVLILLFGIIGVLFFYLYTGNGILQSIFSQEDAGNIRRIEEIKYLVSNMSFWGWGLGSELGYFGATVNNYGTEVIYLNIFHKFGIFALPIIGCYISTFIRTIKYLKNNNTADSTIPLALMAYLFPSLANPMLFGTISVTSHMIAMILITRQDDAALCKGRTE